MQRRRFLKHATLAASAASLGASLRRWGVPTLLAAESALPSVPLGAMAGDVSGDEAVVWSRADRPARLIVEYATTESFQDVRRIVGPAALPESDFTARVVLSGLPRGQRLFYRALFQDLSDLRRFSPPAGGSFLTAPATARDITFTWSADTAGQGFGINPEWGGMKAYETMRAGRPDFFIHCGDTIYADNPLQAEVALDGGAVWRNLVTEPKSKVAETLDDYRGNYAYNLLDGNLRRFVTEVPQVLLWDDHEVLNNWYTTQILNDDRYREKSVALLAARAKRAFLEYSPLRVQGDDPERIHRKISYGPALDVFILDMRSRRGPNGQGRETAASDATVLLGEAQLAWLKSALAGSRATWKVLVLGMPIGLLVLDDYKDPKAGFESIANGDGPPTGRELEIAELLRFVRDRGVHNVVFLTGDVHYAAAHHYDPARARFKDFAPFWEFVAGPLHAGTFGPNALDDTFGAEVRFLGIPKDMKPNRPPSDGLQFYGTVHIDGKTEVMTVGLHDLSGKRLFNVELPPVAAHSR